MNRMLQKKFTLTAMIAITVLLLVLLGVINGVNAWTNRQQIERQLDMLCTQADEAFPREPDFFDPGFARGDRRLFGPEQGGVLLMDARYYKIWADSEGQVTRMDTEHIEYGSELEAQELYESVAGRSSGRTEAFRFRTVETGDGGTTTVLLYDAQQRDGVLRVLALSALAGLVCWGLMFLLVRFLSGRAIAPIAANMEKQKRFVTDAGHELKTPLAIILANTEALELRAGESKYTRNIRGQVDRLTGLTQNLLTLARADEGGKFLQKCDFDLSALTEELAQSFREPAELKGLRLETEICPEIGVNADREQISQLVSILLDNAVKYTPEGGGVRVTLAKEDRAVIRVRNRVEDRSVPAERFFDRFYRSDEARSQKSGGCGIGLSAARAIAELHHGTLDAAYEGEDLVFTLKL